MIASQMYVMGDSVAIISEFVESLVHVEMLHLYILARDLNST